MAVLSFTTQLPAIPSTDFTKQNMIGKGGFGSVYYGTWNEVAIAIKELLVQPADTLFSQEFHKEAQLMARCQHPHITRLYGICLEPGKLALIMEYLEKGSLYNLLKDVNADLSWPRRYSIAADIGKGLTYLHSQNVVHQDLKSHNVLIAKDDTAKITDFGLAKVKLETSTKTNSGQPQGSTRWIAPELFEPNNPANAASDVYSFGMVLWEIASRRIPFSHMANEFIIISWKNKNIHETCPSDWPSEYTEIIQKCWTLPKERPISKDITKKLSVLQQKTNPTNSAPPPSSPVIEEEGSLSKTARGKIEVSVIKPILPVANNIPGIAFGKAEWAKYFGDVGVEPPLPPDIHTILSSPCPFWPHKKVQDTHLLVLVPQTVNGKALTLQHLGDLIQKPLQGTPTKYRYFDVGEYKDMAAAKSHWALLTRDVIERSRGKGYSHQQALIQGTKHYEVPNLLDATLAILLEHARTGTRLYSDSHWTWTRCQEKYNKDLHLDVGGFSAEGLRVFSNYDNFGNGRVGIGGLRKF